LRCVVTGGAGFIGSHLVDRLVADGHDVAVLDDLSTGCLENLARSFDRVRFVRADVRDRSALAEAMRGAEVVFHQAALAAVARSVDRPEHVHAVNVDGTLRVLVAARDARVRRIVFASSSSVYGDAASAAKHEDLPVAPLSPYAATKAAGESYLQAFQATYGLEGVALRYFNVYGDRQSPRSTYAAVVPLFLDALRTGRAVRVFGDGRQTRDFTYVGDVVDAVVLAAVAPPPATGRPINVAGGRPASVLELASTLAEVLGSPLRLEHAPARRADVRHSCADVGRARDVLGWTARTDLRRGLERTVEAVLAGSVA
jgi:UDP-glucose 4-epimerase